LTEQWKNGRTAVAPNHWYLDRLGIFYILNMGHESGRPDDIECCHAKDLSRVKYPVLLQSLDGDWEGTINGIGDNEYVGLGAELCNSRCEILNDTSVCIK
jgi:hypothetical protein